jgi:hypothetical protein
LSVVSQTSDSLEYNLLSTNSEQSIFLFNAMSQMGKCERTPHRLIHVHLIIMVSQTRRPRKRGTAAQFDTSKRFFTGVRSKMSRQSASLHKSLSTAWLSTHKRFLTRMRTKMFRQTASHSKRLSTAWLSAGKWFFASMRSQVSRQNGFL